MDSSVIKLLPEQVANQIAAGEVIQRPASVLKELLENAVDAGAKNIQVIVKDAGRSLIQVIDDGVGMNEQDATLCFTRHATSKISIAEDLFELNSKGFRGEAMASIASIAHVELKTKLKQNELGYLVEIEGGKITNKTACQHKSGTSVCVKNLFFNVPARRKFLKSDHVESKHLNDEFTRVALIHPDIQFSLHVNNQLIYSLTPSNFKQRIVAVFGKSYKEKLVPVEEQTDFISISGFILKPEYSKKTRGEQFFFANNRFIKHSYFHHAVNQAFQDLIAPNAHPSYFVQLTVHPKDIDVNIHPTKTEIKFSDERSIYAILKTVVQRSLNQHSLAPTLDFEQETTFDTSSINWDKPLKNPEIKVDKNYNPFENKPQNNWSKGSSFKTNRSQDNANWEQLYTNSDNDSTSVKDGGFQAQNSSSYEVSDEQQDIFNSGISKAFFYKQFQKKYLITENETGLLVINQKRAHERVLFEHFLNLFDQKNNSTQQLLFPETIEIAAKDMVTISALLPDFTALGFDISLFGKDSFVINGVPADLKEVSPKNLIEDILRQFSQKDGNIKLAQREKLAVGMAKKIAVKYGQELQDEEIKTLCEQLFLCENPLTSPTGKPTLINYNINLIDKQLS